MPVGGVRKICVGVGASLEGEKVPDEDIVNTNVVRMISKRKAQSTVLLFLLGREWEQQIAVDKIYSR